MRVLCAVVGASQRTDGSRLNHVADGESLDRLILGRASRAVAAADGLGVAAALLVAAAVKMLASNSMLHDCAMSSILQSSRRYEIISIHIGIQNR